MKQALVFLLAVAVLGSAVAAQTTKPAKRIGPKRADFESPQDVIDAIPKRLYQRPADSETGLDKDKRQNWVNANILKKTLIITGQVADINSDDKQVWMFVKPDDAHCALGDALRFPLKVQTTLAEYRKGSRISVKGKILVLNVARDGEGLCFATILIEPKVVDTIRGK